jgi:hypothetical protein
MEDKIAGASPRMRSRCQRCVIQVRKSDLCYCVITVTFNRHPEALGAKRRASKETAQVGAVHSSRLARYARSRLRMTG